VKVNAQTIKSTNVNVFSKMLDLIQEKTHTQSNTHAFE